MFSDVSDLFRIYISEIWERTWYHSFIYVYTTLLKLNSLSSRLPHNFPRPNSLLKLDTFMFQLSISQNILNIYRILYFFNLQNSEPLRNFRILSRSSFRTLPLRFWRFLFYICYIVSKCPSNLVQHMIASSYFSAYDSWHLIFISNNVLEKHQSIWPQAHPTMSICMSTLQVFLLIWQAHT